MVNDLSHLIGCEKACSPFPISQTSLGLGHCYPIVVKVSQDWLSSRVASGFRLALSYPDEAFLGGWARGSNEADQGGPTRFLGRMKPSQYLVCECSYKSMSVSQNCMELTVEPENQRGTRGVLWCSGEEGHNYSSMEFRSVGG